MSAPARAPFRVGEWLVDPETDSITRDGRHQKLEPRMMRLLLLLADSPGAVIGSERMLREIWPGVVVSSSSVYTAISQLRRLLGDTDSEPTYIATVPRKGYRLIASVRLDGAAVEQPKAIGDVADSLPVATTIMTPTVTATPIATIVRSEPPMPMPSRDTAGRHSRASRRGLLIILAGALLVVGAVWLIGRTWLHRTPPAATEITPAIVVLPFTDMTQDGRDQFFCDGLSEELSNWLAQVPTLRVVARTSAFAFRGHQDAREIGRELNITHVVEGSMRRYGDHMRITVQLIDARTGFHLWSSEYDREPQDTITLQEDVARAVAESLQIRLTEDTAARFAERRSASAHAYDLYLLALHYQGERTRDANKQAIDLFHQVLSADPKFALAYVGLAFATLNQRWLIGQSVAETTAAAQSLLQTAEQLDPQLPELYAVRGALRDEQGRIDDAERDARHAIVLNPNDARAYATLGRLMLDRARPRDALDSLARAIALDPLDFMLHARQCLALQDMARYPEAAAACDRSRELQGTSNFGSIATGWLELSQGRIPEALQWNADAQRLSPDDINLYERRANLLLALQLPRPARQLLEQARVATRDDDRVEMDLSPVIFYEEGIDALRAHLATLHPDHLRETASLMELVHYYLIAGDLDAARQIVSRAKTASDANAVETNAEWYARLGKSNELLIAICELRSGQHEAGVKHAQEVLTMLDEATAQGEQQWGIYLLKARALALLGNNDGAMAALTRAADLGWRESWWAGHDEWFEGLRSRSDFRALMARVDASVRQLRDRSQLAN